MSVIAPIDTFTLVGLIFNNPQANGTVCHRRLQPRSWVGRSVARGRSNTISNNPYAGIEVFNFGTYRTGSFIVPTQANNDGPFETISVGASGVVAVEIGQMSFIDLRQVLITGNVNVFRQNMAQIRGDNVGPDLFCSQIDGDLSASSTFAQARLRFTHVTGATNGTIGGDNEPIGNCPNLP